MPTDTKTALLNAAERAARERGFDGFSYGDLAADVGIRKASIHHHFPTKAALSVALVERYLAAFEKICTDIDATGASGGMRLAALIDRYRDAVGAGTSLCLCVAFSISREALPQDTIAEIARFRAMMTEWIAGCFRRARGDGSIADVGAPLQEAAATLALLEGAQLATRVAKNPDSFDSAVARLRARLT